MSQYAMFRQKLFSRIDGIIKGASEGESNGIDAQLLLFQVEKSTGASRSMISKYLSELQEHGYVVNEGGRLIWQKSE